MASAQNIETFATTLRTQHILGRKNMKQFENKVVLVTGGTSGIGRDTALAFAHEGARVVVSGRREKEGTETVDLIRKAGGQALFVQADVSQEDAVARLIGRTVEAFGRLDIAFNNAGTEGDIGPLSEATTDNYQKIFDANVKGVFLSIKHEVAQMLKQGGGAIVNNASIAGLVGFPGAALYAASKHAVLGLTKTVALELAKQNIRVNAVSPAAIQTDMLDRFIGQQDDAKAGLATLHPIGRIGRPEEITAAVLFLSSARASFITGQNLTVDGGFTAQ
jgi:NAD(P)-dependent dehydrogenase (short-subunit alcohol dehydrogenase family)